VNLKREHVQRLFDICVNSMDFGSGFLESDDIEVLRAVAVSLGVDALVATPSEFKRNYAHPYVMSRDGESCVTCAGDKNNVKHI